MSSVDVTCAVLREMPPEALDPRSIHRFVVGRDTAPQPLSAEDAAAQLGDPFATLLLLQDVFPVTAGDVLTALDAATEDGDSLRRRKFFLVGEGSQIAFTPATAQVNRALRFLVTAGADGTSGPDLLISAFHPDTTDVELMAWDRSKGGFNYYRTMGESSGWVFAGNSRDALAPDSEGKGPFEAHPSGNVIMKELRFPWLHWHSAVAPITAAVFGADDPLRDHPWFRNLEPGGAYALELEEVKPSIQRWTSLRFDELAAAGEVARPARVLEQIVDTPAFNIITSQTETAAAAGLDFVDLPQTFFVDSEALTEVLGLQAPPGFSVSSSIYLESIDEFEFRLESGQFAFSGDAHFAFPVPERAFEDTRALAEAIRIGLVSERLAACLLMTDFPNPVFSPRRAELLRHAPARAAVANGTSTFSEEMAEAILAVAEAAGPDSPESEFARLWAAGETWKESFNPLLSAYYKAVTAQLRSQSGFNAYCELAEARRERARDTPLAEFDLLFPVTNIDGTVERSMRSDATVAVGQS